MLFINFIPTWTPLIVFKFLEFNLFLFQNLIKLVL